MTKKQNILIPAAVFLLVSLLFFIFFSEHGLMAEKNELLSRESITMSSEIDRLQHDPKYIESIARQELGMVGQDELILKPQNSPKP